jgi:magnesium chelatase family protein
VPEGLRHATARRQVFVARQRQEGRAGCLNARLPVSRLPSDCTLDPAARALFDRVKDRLAVSGRGLHRLLRVARTVADLAGCDVIGEGHFAEAIQLRRPLV